VLGVAFHPTKNLLASCSADRTIKTWDITSGSCLSTLNVDGQGSSIDFAPCGTKIAATFNIYDGWAFKEGGVKILNSQTGALLCALRGHTDPVWSVRFSPCGEKIASGGGDRYGNRDYSIRIWDAKTGEQIGSPLTGHGDAVSSLAFRPDDPNVLVTGSWDKTVKLWELSTSTCLSTMRGHRYAPSLSRECFLSCCQY
jgi:WD40 repeat protein